MVSTIDLWCNAKMETGNPFKIVALFGKYNAQGIADPLLSLANNISQRGHHVVFEHDTAHNIGAAAANYTALDTQEIGSQADVAIVIGGDGTMLGVGRQLTATHVPLIGVNHGRVGFITDIPLHQMHHVIPSMLEGQFEAEQRTLLAARVKRDGNVLYETLAFNDVVVNRNGLSGMIELRVDVDGRFMYKQRSDGLIVATPTGSTAYALSASGPILHPMLGGVVLVPIAPYALSNRPIVLPDTTEIVITIEAAPEVGVNFDMQSFSELLLGDQIIINRSEHNVTFLHPVGYNYYATLRRKLHWNQHISKEDDLS
ncbi:NAD kinase [Candidatus Pandoraea novymonadis]|uniref:NAD kinase n=1 Tax=Candidatus Pandoraea novymonadis TaxID=1808959 RepID=A0ABX5FDY8_9BURK|nr:NAD kinase [Candidatus Pandoraea novymonadis]PSB91874.1 NAD kinase [Candidatus Pandoraea novymonadis]